MPLASELDQTSTAGDCTRGGCELSVCRVFDLSNVLGMREGRLRCLRELFDRSDHAVPRV